MLDSYMSTALTDSFGSPHPSSNINGSSASASVNFTQYLTMFGEHLSELDEAAELNEAFECFDEKDDGVIDAAELRYWLKEVGDRMTDAEVRRQRHWCVLLRKRLTHVLSLLVRECSG